MLRKLTVRASINPVSYRDLYIDPLDIKVIEDYGNISCITVAASSSSDPQFFFVKETPEEIIFMVERESVLHAVAASMSARYSNSQPWIQCTCVPCSHTWTTKPVEIGKD